MKAMKTQFDFDGYGKLELDSYRNGSKWFGRVDMPISKASIELTIEVENQNHPSNQQIELIKEFDAKWPTTSHNLFQLMEESFRGSKREKGKDELLKMYFLSAVDLIRGNSEWWIVFEPEFHVPSIFNFLPKFILKNDEVVWSSL